MNSAFVRRNRTSPRDLFLLFALLLASGFLAGCGSSGNRPPLPQHAAVSAFEQPAQTNFAAIVEHADIIYFPSDFAAFGARAEPAALLLEALENSGHPLAIAWDLIDASQQDLLDQLQSASGAAREEIIARLELVGSGRTREHCRAVLRNLPEPAGKQIALRLPPTLIAKIASGAPLNAEEENFLPRDYRGPAGGLENFTERLRTGAGGDAGAARAYRVELVRQQFIAETIVRYLRGAPSGGRLLVFLASSDLRTDSGVPFYVGQKSRLRQLVLGPDAPVAASPRILTQR